MNNGRVTAKGGHLDYYERSDPTMKVVRPRTWCILNNGKDKNKTGMRGKPDTVQNQNTEHMI